MIENARANYAKRYLRKKFIQKTVNRKILLSRKTKRKIESSTGIFCVTIVQKMADATKLSCLEKPQSNFDSKDGQSTIISCKSAHYFQ